MYSVGRGGGLEGLQWGDDEYRPLGYAMEKNRGMVFSFAVMTNLSPCELYQNKRGFLLL
jgi:hypothetical protein